MDHFSQNLNTTKDQIEKLNLRILKFIKDKQINLNEENKIK